MAAAGPRATPLGPGAGPPGPTSPRAGVRRVGWVWPLTPRPIVVHPFRAPAGPYGPGHRGVDLSAQVAGCGPLTRSGRSQASLVWSPTAVSSSSTTGAGYGAPSSRWSAGSWSGPGSTLETGSPAWRPAPGTAGRPACTGGPSRRGYVDPLRYLGPVRSSCCRWTDPLGQLRAGYGQAVQPRRNFVCWTMTGARPPLRAPLVAVAEQVADLVVDDATR